MARYTRLRNFAAYPIAAIREIAKTCTPMSVAIFGELIYRDFTAEHDGNRVDADGWFIAPMEQIETRLACSRHTVKRALDRLVDLGAVLRRSAGPGLPTAYKVSIDDAPMRDPGRNSTRHRPANGGQNSTTTPAESAPVTPAESAPVSRARVRSGTDQEDISQRKNKNTRARRAEVLSPLEADAHSVVEHINSATGRRLRYADRPLLARLKDGATLDECRLVIDHLHSQPFWRSDGCAKINTSSPFRADGWDSKREAALSWDLRGRPQQTGDARTDAMAEERAARWSPSAEQFLSDMSAKREA